MGSAERRPASPGQQDDGQSPEHGMLNFWHRLGESSVLQCPECRDGYKILHQAAILSRLSARDHHFLHRCDQAHGMPERSTTDHLAGDAPHR